MSKDQANDPRRTAILAAVAVLVGGGILYWTLTDDGGAAEQTGDPNAIGFIIPAPPDVAAPPADTEATASGLHSRVLSAGEGTRHPGPTSRVQVHYTGWTTDGEMFDSSVVRGEPATFGLDQVIAGWTEGLQLMVEGEERRLWIPQDLAYRGQPNRPAGMLVFDVELIRVLD
jgi:peptidylprolyl isomerase